MEALHTHKHTNAIYCRSITVLHQQSTMHFINVVYSILTNLTKKGDLVGSKMRRCITPGFSTMYLVAHFWILLVHLFKR